MPISYEPDWFLPDEAPPSKGDNAPPDMTVTALETMKALSDWMAEHPVIDGHDAAKEAKVLLDRGKLCIKDLDDERRGKVDPLNKQVAEVNGHYRAPREQLEKVLQVINIRLTAYIYEEERRRFAAAAEAQLKLEEAERVAREAEAKEREAKEAAEQGELGVDIAGKVGDANAAFSAFERAQRAAAVAEKDTKVKVTGGFTRAVALRTETVLSVTDPVKAVKALMPNAFITEAIIKAARAYHKLKDKYPPGIEAKTERKL